MAFGELPGSRRRTLVSVALTGALTALGLAGCAGTEDTASGAATTPAPSASAAATAGFRRSPGVDGRTVQGSYTVTLADPALPAAALALTAGTPAPAADSGGIPAGVLIALAALGVILAVIAVRVYVVTRRRPAVGA